MCRHRALTGRRGNRIRTTSAAPRRTGTNFSILSGILPAAGERWAQHRSPAKHVVATCMAIRSLQLRTACAPPSEGQVRAGGPSVFQRAHPPRPPLSARGELSLPAKRGSPNSGPTRPTAGVGSGPLLLLFSLWGRPRPYLGGMSPASTRGGAGLPFFALGRGVLCGSGVGDTSPTASSRTAGTGGAAPFWGGPALSPISTSIRSPPPPRSGPCGGGSVKEPESPGPPPGLALFLLVVFSSREATPCGWPSAASAALLR